MQRFLSLAYVFAHPGLPKPPTEAEKVQFGHG